MAPRYIPVDRDQQFLLPPDLREWLPAGHLAGYVIEVIGILDTTAFHRDRINDNGGRPAYDPDMLLGVLLYAYMTGVLSSRQIEARCVTDVGFRVLSANQFPDHSTISRFRSRNSAAIKELFVQTVAMCARAGMVKAGVIAIDGTKMAADASLGSNKSYKALKEELDKIVDEAQAIDEQEDQEDCGPTDRLPEALRDKAARKAFLEEALAEIESRMSRFEHHDKTIEKRTAQLITAEQTVAEQHARHQAIREQGRTPRERPVTIDHVAGAKELLDQAREGKQRALMESRTKINTTDCDSRIMQTAKGGFIQGYNAQIAVSASQVIIAAELHPNAADVGALHPMIKSAGQMLEDIGHDEEIEIVLADAGYCSEENLANKNNDAPALLIATTKRHKQGKENTGARLTCRPIAEMDKRLEDKTAKQLYKKRSVMVEPVFGQIKSARGITQIIRRGKQAAQSEWELICGTHNLLKRWRYLQA